MIEQDFLTLIRETEDRAEAMVADAQAEARQQVDDARLEADRRIALAREDADNLIRQTLDEARQLAEEKGRQEADAVTGQAEAMRKSAEPAIEDAIRIIMERIVK